MKKFWLTLGLTLILTGWGGPGYLGFDITPALGKRPPYPPPPYYNPYYTPPPSNYYNYYSAPYTDPFSQFLYYVAPRSRGEEDYEDWENRRRERFAPGHRGRGHEEFEEHEHRGRGHGER
jgi:hypothetical protein